MDVQELRNLQEAYLDVYQELDEGSVADKARSAVANQRLDDAQRDTQASVNKLRGRRDPVTRASASIAANKVERDVKKASAYGPQRPKAGQTGAYRIQEPTATGSKPSAARLGSRKGGTRSALMGMSSSLSGSGSPSGTRGFTPGQGGRYGIGGVGLADDYNVYDEVLEYLLGEGYTEEESNLIMVELVTEGGLQDFIGAVQRRTGIGKPGVGPGQVLKNIVKAGISDISGASIAAGSAPSSVSPAKPVPSVTKSPTPVVRATTKAPRTAPKGANIAPDPWKQPSSSRTAKPPTTPTRTSTTPKALTGSPTPKALSGTQARPALPSGAKGGALVKTTPKGGEIVPTRGAKPSFNPKALQSKTTPTAEPGGALVSTRAPRGAKPTLNRQALPQPKPTAEPGGALVSTKAPRGAKPTLNRQALPQPKPTAQRGGALVSTKTTTPKPSAPAEKPTQVRSQQYQDVQRLNKMTGGGTMGSREVPGDTHRAPKPAWGSGAKASKPAAAKPSPAQAPKPVDKVTPKPAKPSVKPRKLGGLDSLPDLGGRQGFTPPIGGPYVTAAALGVQAYNTNPGTRDTAPKFPTTAKEVKKGETYYDPNTRVGPLGRFAQRKKVGPKIVGPGKVGTEAQSFNKAYGAAKAKGGMGSTFEWKGKHYKVS